MEHFSWGQVIHKGALHTQCYFLLCFKSKNELLRSKNYTCNVVSDARGGLQTSRKFVLYKQVPLFPTLKRYCFRLSEILLTCPASASLGGNAQITYVEQSSLVKSKLPPTWVAGRCCQALCCCCLSPWTLLHLLQESYF